MLSKRAAFVLVLLPVLVLLLGAISSAAHAQNVTFAGAQTVMPANEFSSSQAKGSSAAAGAAAPRGLSSLPATAQGPISAALGRDDSRYWLQGNAGKFHAENPQHALAADFTAQGVQIHSKEVRNKGARWGLALRGYGYGNDRTAVKQAAPRAKTNRVEYERGGLTEWYINGPMGLEQGFTLAQPPGKANGRPLTVALALSGDLTAALDADGTALTLKGRNGQAALRLAGLVAYDAAGRGLPGRFALRGEELLLQVDDAGAQYPLVVDPFVQQQELTASDGATGDYFGYSVALSGNGNTALVGTDGKTVGSHSYQGVAYVFTRSGGSWSQQQELTASDGAANDWFGTSVALSSDGNTALVGAWGKGAAYVFTRVSGSWSQQQELTTASNGTGGGKFGVSVALSGDGNTALVGAIYKAVGSNSGQGAAYVFTNSGGSWSQQQELTASNGAAQDQFGNSVALSGDGNTALVGTDVKKVGSNSQQGAAYVFTRSGGTWSQQQELTASDGAAWDEFGVSVALSGNGNTALVGAFDKTVGSNSVQGAAYVFASSGGSWSQQQELAASDGATWDQFGDSVALSGDGNTALVGAGNATYVFTNSGGSWSQQQELAVAGVVALSSDGNTALVGAYLNTVGSNYYQGAAYVFAGTATVNVTVGTSPAGLAFSVDGTSYSAARSFAWTVGSAHTIATVSPQTPSAGVHDAFASWSDGGALSHSVTAPAGSTAYTASFNPAYLLTTAANPTNGGTVTPASGTYYAAGTVVNLTAKAKTGYKFSNWTGNVANANSASTTVTMSAPEAVAANFLPSTTTTLVSSLNPSTYGQAVTFTATITPQGGGQATGTVTFKNGTAILGAVAVSGNAASLTTKTLTGGTHSITAVYSGDSSFAGSISKAVKQVVDKATTRTTLGSSGSPSNVGQSVTFTATVTPEFGGTVTGKVAFSDGLTLLKTVALSGGVAKFTTKNLTSGTHTITATYGGSASFVGSSDSLTQTVN